MNPDELDLPEPVRDALNDLLGEGWDNSAEAVVAHIDSQAAQIKALKEALVERVAQDRIQEMCRFGFVLDSASDPYVDARRALAENPELKAVGVNWKIEELETSVDKAVELVRSHPPRIKSHLEILKEIKVF